MNKYNYEALDAVNKVCAWLEDDESKMILKQRFLYNLTGDIRYIYDMLKLTGFSLDMLKGEYERILKQFCEDVFPREDLLTFLLNRKNEKIVVFGCGRESFAVEKLLNFFVEGRMTAFADNFKKGMHLGYPVIKAEEIPGDSIIVISTQLHRDEILCQLKELGYKEEQIFYPDANTLFCLFGDTYFDEQIFPSREEGIFVDGGAFHGETAKMFVQWAKSYREVMAFEPDARNVNVCKKNLNSLENVKVFRAGLWNENEKLLFKRMGDDGSGSQIGTEGDIQVDGVALDSIVSEKVSFIKLDIEGAELRALMGAQNIIRRDRPRMAICIYHKPEDIWEIPMFIKEIVPEYHMLVRHHSTYTHDTILYCWI